MDDLEAHTESEPLWLAVPSGPAQMTREEALAMRGAHAIGEVPEDAGPRY